jgi:ribonuclease P protein component
MPNTFPKHLRLLKPAQFKWVFAQAIKLPAQDWTCLYRPNALDHPRLGLVMSKKNTARAHERNRLKRIARETFRQAQTQLTGVDILLMAKAHTQHQENTQIRVDLEKTLSKLGEICENLRPDKQN